MLGGMFNLTHLGLHPRGKILMPSQLLDGLKCESKLKIVEE
jgi:hypothetical protein